MNTVAAGCVGVKFAADHRASANSGWRVRLAGSNAVVVLGEDGAIRCDEHSAERLVARLQSLGC